MSLVKSVVRGVVGLGGASSRFTWNGTNQYATHASWTVLGDPAIYVPTITYTTDNDDGFIVDPTLPITEFGRVGTNYHSGSLRDLRYGDPSPLHGRYAYDASVAEVVIPGVTVGDSTLTMHLVYATGAQDLIYGSEVLLSVAADKLVSIYPITVDGVAYANQSLVDGRHYVISVGPVTNAYVTITNVGGICKIGKFTITGVA